MADLTRLTAPNGSTVRVSAERAKRLVESEGFVPAEKPKSSAKKPASEKSEK